MSGQTFKTLPNNPHVQFWTGPDMLGRFWIEIRCVTCGPRTHFRRLCSRPSNAPAVVAKYAMQHQHG